VVNITLNLLRYNVLRSLCPEQERSAGTCLAGSTLGQEVDKGAYLWDKHWSQHSDHHVTRGLTCCQVSVCIGRLVHVIHVGALWMRARVMLLLMMMMNTLIYVGWHLTFQLCESPVCWRLQSVRLSNVTRMHCDKTKWCTADILITHERAITLLFRNQQ